MAPILGYWDIRGVNLISYASVLNPIIIDNFNFTHSCYMFNS